jgi:hypothetical protein
VTQNLYLQHAGDLGNITAGPDGRATFRLTDKVIKLWDIIGRSVVVTDGADDLGQGNHPRSSEDGNSGQRLVFLKCFSLMIFCIFQRCKVLYKSKLCDMNIFNTD